MSIKAIAVGLLLLLPQLGFVWTDARAPVEAVAVDWDTGDDREE